MILEGDYEVIDGIIEKKRLMDNGEQHEHIKPLLILGGGMMKGVYGAGASQALADLGMKNVFNAIAGISSGAATAAYFYSENATIAASIFSEECTTRKFWNIFRVLNPLDVKYVKSILEGKSGKGIGLISKEHLLRLRIGMSSYETGLPYMLQPQSIIELIDGVTASIAMPGPVSDYNLVRGVRFADGASSLPHVATLFTAEKTYTHILYIVNQDQSDTDISILEKLINNSLYRYRMCLKLRFASNQRRKTDMLYIKQLLQDNTRKVCVVWGNGSIPSITRDAVLIKNTIEKSRQWWLELLKETSR